MNDRNGAGPGRSGRSPHESHGPALGSEKAPYLAADALPGVIARSPLAAQAPRDHAARRVAVSAVWGDGQGIAGTPSLVSRRSVGGPRYGVGDALHRMPREAAAA